MSLNQCRLHIGSEHPESNRTPGTNNNLLGTSTTSTTSPSARVETPGTSIASVETSGTSTVDPGAGTSSETVHTNPGWCSHLVKNFKSVVIAKCCQRTKDAVETDEKIQVHIFLL